MFSTPDSCSSIGAATVFASVSALAPGYVALIVTVGGAISGYCAIGRICEAMTPASAMMIAMTLAKIGRWMKKREKLPIDVPRQRALSAAGACVDGDGDGEADACFDGSSGTRGCTAVPGRSFIRLSTITRSP